MNMPWHAPGSWKRSARLYIINIWCTDNLFYLRKCIPDDGRHWHLKQNILVDGFCSLEHLMHQPPLTNQFLPSVIRNTSTWNLRWWKPPSLALPFTFIPSFCSTTSFCIPELSIYHGIKCFLQKWNLISQKEISRTKALQIVMWATKSPTISIESNFWSAGRLTWMSARALGVIICSIMRKIDLRILHNMYCTLKPRGVQKYLHSVAIGTILLGWDQLNHIVSRGHQPIHFSPPFALPFFRQWFQLPQLPKNRCCKFNLSHKRRWKIFHKTMQKFLT